MLCAGLTVSASGRSRITPYNWSFITDLWAQIAFWAHSLVFVLASILVPKLLIDMQFHDVVLLAALIVAVFAARVLVLFLLLPLLSLAKLTQPISTAYKLAIAWGGLRGALTLVLALAVTENPALKPEIQRFVAVLATGLVLFTLLVNGTTLRFVIHLLHLDRLSPIDQALRDRVLALSYTEIGETIRSMANEHEISPSAVTSALAPYEAGMAAANPPDAAEAGLTDHQRLAIGLVALGNQERMLALEIMAERAASPITVQALLRNAEALGEGARSGGRLGYQARRRRRARLSVLFRRRLFLLSPFRNRALSRRSAGRPVRDAARHASPDPGARRRARRALALDLRRAGRRAHRRHPQCPPQAHDFRSRRAAPAISAIRGGARSKVPAPVRDATRNGTLRHVVPGRSHRGRGLRRSQRQRRGQKREKRGPASTLGSTPAS